MPVTATSIKISIAELPSSQSDYLVTLSQDSKEIARVSVPKDQFLAGGSLDPAKISGILQDTNTHCDDILEKGRDLRKAILTGDVGERWFECYQQVQDDYEAFRLLPPFEHENAPLPLLRTYLHLADPALDALPWESLADEDGPLFFHPASTLIRLNRVRLLPLSAQDIWPIIVLVVVGAEKNEIESLNVRDEVHALTQVFRKANHSFLVHTFYAYKAAGVGLESVTQGGRFNGGYINAVKAEVAKYQPQILHFIGHAGTDPAGLRVGDEIWSSKDLFQWLKTQPTRLRMAYLNACRTQVEALALPSVARAFLKAGALSTIAMQADIRGEAASECARAFYDQVVIGHSIDVALSQARIALSAQRRDAYLPALTVEGDPDRLLTGCHVAPPDQRVIHIGEPRYLPHFVNRSSERYEILMRLLAAPNPKDRYNVMALCGSTDIGKTGLAYWSLRTMAWRNHLVIYTDVRGHKDCASLLRSIIEGDPNDVLRPIMPQKAFVEFLKLSPSGSAADDVKNIDRLFAVFVDGVRAAAGDRTAILCLDEWKRDETRGDPLPLLPILVKHLLNPIARGDGKIKAILPVSSERDLFSLSDPPDGSWRFLPIPLFDGGDYPDLLREWFEARYKDWRRSETYFKKRSRPTTPEAFLQICKAIEISDERIHP